MTQLPQEVRQFFPYTTVRPYQDQFIETIFNAVENRQSVLIEGSNGLGKTISALSACLPKAIEKNMKILYLARTHRQHERVIEELKAISKKRPVTGISLRGRNEMCLNELIQKESPDAKSLMEACEVLKSKAKCPYYKNIDEQSFDYLQLVQSISLHPYKSIEIQKICQKRGICPYELIKACLSEVRVIALSYLYIFDPEIRTAFLKNIDTHLQKIILIVDEAHNLPETAIDVSSSSLSLYVMKQAELEAHKFNCPDIEGFTSSVREETSKMIETIQREARIPPSYLIEMIQEKCGVANPQEFFEHLHDVGTTIKRRLIAEGKNPRSYIHSMSEFLLRWLETVDDDSFINVATKYATRENTTSGKLEIVALDPSKITQPVFSACYSNIVMSGTLQPIEAYKKIAKLPENTVECVVPSPFPREHILSLACLGVTTALADRTPTMYQTIMERIIEVVQNTPANTGIFAASFDVLNSLIQAGLPQVVDKPLFNESRGMSSKANETMVTQFKDSAKKDGAVFLGVQGGRTSEGVDFPGDQMNSVIIVGIPYAEPTPRVKAQIEYYEKRFPRLGREYGYVLPAMKKASQAAGRPIRTLEDMAAIIFMDQRFTSNYCRSFLPLWVRKDMKTIPDKPGALAQEVYDFFNHQTR
jgi:DNA excision repair protein ERCC-2